MSAADDGNVVEFKHDRDDDRGPELHVKCPRCGKSNFMHDRKCEHCGLWFAGEAFQFAPRDAIPNRRRILVLKIILWYFVAVAAFIAIAVVFGGLKQ
jgi:uncharacterized membrane protein YvbJ